VSARIIAGSRFERFLCFLLIDVRFFRIAQFVDHWLRLLVADFPRRQPGFEPRSDHVEFVVGEVALGQVFSEYFGFPCQSFHRLLHASSSKADTTGQIAADVPS
jgi:hypothetical protein